ncbi:MAG: bifunctional riboflavin kinase/FAD synthetase [Gammaproteobacteria bacterium]
MELIRYLHNIKDRHHGCVATIGNFDGVHLGHQAVFQQLRRHALRLKLPAVVMIFEPQPLEYFSPDTAPARLTGFREKIEWLQEHGIDRVICLRFQQSLAALSAEQFVEQLLVQALGVRYVIVGDDFRFGHGRQGNFRMMQAFGRRYGFEVVATETLSSDGTRVSSSRIRDLLTAGRLEQAKNLLGRPYTISGRVIHGDERGRKLGFPTANMALKRRLSPLLGVYVVLVKGLREGIYNGVANIGTRPVFDGKQLLLEVHLLDFNGDIYGQHLHVEFLKHLRAEKNFASVDQLCAQMETDIEEARAFFKYLIQHRRLHGRR